VAVDTIVAGFFQKSLLAIKNISVPFPVNPQEHANYG
jgi:hypothetical protein